MTHASTDARITRRQALIGAAGLGGLAVLGFGGYEFASTDGSSAPAADHVLRASQSDVTIGAREQRTWAYGERVPGPELRLTRGEQVRIRLENELPADTTVHWHGIRLRNDMDGVPGLTQDPVKPGEQFLYEFVPPDAGTFFYHSHVGVQLDRSLYGPLIVEDPGEQLPYDVDAVLVIDDWLGDDGDPDAVLRNLQHGAMSHGGSGMSGMAMGSGSGMAMMNMGLSPARLTRLRTAARIGPYRTLSGAAPRLTQAAGLANAMRAGAADSGDVRYRAHLINGHVPLDPEMVRANPGQVIRLRLINAAGDTLYLVHGDGAPLSVVAADGLPVERRETDAILMGMGERYDVLIKATDRPVRIVAEALGKGGVALAAIVPTGANAELELSGVTQPVRVLGQEDLTAKGGALRVSDPAATHPLVLGWSMPYTWTVSDPDGGDEDLNVRLGSQVRLAMRNDTSMPHPMHFHGHSFRVVQGETYGPLKDTVLVAPGDTIAVDVAADNPGKWMLHCHNAYHLGANMMRTVVVKA